MPRGGVRAGAGRPRGQGRYGEKTQAMRVPVSLVGKVKQSLESGAFQVPLYASKVAAGFPSPADDFIETRLDANDLVLDNPGASFFLRVTGDSMQDAGILPGDYIVVDRSREAQRGDIVVAAIDGEFTVKRLDSHNGKPVLQPANRAYRAIELAEGEELSLFGVVCGVVRRLGGR